MLVCRRLDRADVRIQEHLTAGGADEPLGLRHIQLRQARGRQTEMQAATADELRMHAQQRGARALLERQVHYRHAGEAPEPVDHALGHAGSPQVVERRNAIELWHIFLAELERAPGRRIVRPQVAQPQPWGAGQVRQQAQRRR